MTIMYLALGTNLGDRQLNLNQAIHEISKLIGTVTNSSKFYRTTPLNPPTISSQPEFLNCVVECQTSLSPYQVLDKIREIEALLGLNWEEKIPWGPRVIDIDILTYDQMMISESELTIPHPELENRDFVLIPLKEIAPQFIHPQTSKTINNLLKDLKEKKTPLHVIDREV